MQDFFYWGAPYTTFKVPNSRYIFREFECCLKSVALSESLSPRMLNDQIFICPHITLHTPNSRYIFRDFECCMKCVVVSESVSLRVLNDQIFVRLHTTLTLQIVCTSFEILSIAWSVWRWLWLTSFRVLKDQNFILSSLWPNG